MGQVFAVIVSQGKSWQEGLRLEDQQEWDAHAAFMDGLTEAGFVLLGGPLEGTREVLLIVRAGSAEEIEARLADDPWRHNGLLQTRQVSPWTLRLGSLG